MQRNHPYNHYLTNGDAARVLWSTLPLDEEVTKQTANSSKIEYFKLSFGEVNTCFDLFDKPADELAAFSTQEAHDCLDTASTQRKRKCNLLINVKKYEKVSTNDGSVSTSRRAHSECKAIFST